MWVSSGVISWWCLRDSSVEQFGWINRWERSVGWIYRPDRLAVTSWLNCNFSQNWGVVSKASDRSHAVTGVMPRCPWTISLICSTGIWRWKDISLCVKPIGSMYSRSRITPGCVDTLLLGIMTSLGDSDSLWILYVYCSAPVISESFPL